MISNIQGSESHSDLHLVGIGTEDQAFITFYNDREKTRHYFLLLFHGMIGKIAISFKVLQVKY
jgi:hypothetical protein